MTRSLPAAFTGEITDDRTRPFWLVQIDFSTPLRYSSREAMTVGGNAFTHVGLLVSRSAQTIAILNESQSLTSTFRTNSTDGVRVRVWMGYGPAVSSFTDLYEELDGEMGPAVVGDVIELRLRREKPLQCPRVTIQDAISEAHLLPDGAVADTASGKVQISTGS